jgi:hypothetical protein
MAFSQVVANKATVVDGTPNINRRRRIRGLAIL